MAEQPSVTIPSFLETNQPLTNTVLGNGVNEIYFYSFSTNSFFNFKAFLTEYNDQYNSNWTPADIYGRMDPIFTYKNTVRKISLGFDVPSENLSIASQNTAYADLLIKSLYPVYNYREGVVGSALIGSPPLFKIKFANLIMNSTKDPADQNPATSGLLGWIDGFNFKPELDSGFHISNNTILYPKLFKVSFTFNVIHEHPLGNTTTEAGIRVTRLERNSQAFSHLYDTTISPEPPPAPSTPRNQVGGAVFANLRGENLEARPGGITITGDQVAALDEVARLGEAQRAAAEEEKRKRKTVRELLDEESDPFDFLNPFR